MDKIFAIENGVEVRIGACCHFCKKELATRSTGGTGHLSYWSFVPSRGQMQAPAWSYWAPVHAKLCRLIARLDLPLNFGESAAFEDYIKIAHNPRYSTVSRQTTTRDVEKHFKDKHAKLVERLQSVSCVALTSDIWSRNANQDYLSVVAHFVNGDWDLQKRILPMRLIDCSHSGVNIAERIADVVAEYGLTDKIFSITLDNASANSKAMETQSPFLSGYVSPLLLHQRCACHIINLIVKSASEELKHFLDDFRTAILFLNSSNQRIAAYKSFCVALGVRSRKFGLDMDVRWNSTYLMLKHLIPYKSTFSVFIQTHYPPRPEGPLLTDDHWHVGEKILEFLKRFYDSTVVMSGVYYPTSPLILHHILCIIRHLNSYENDRLLRTAVVPMKDKDYSAYLTNVRAELSDLFKKYDDKFGAVRLQKPSNATPGEGKSKNAWDLVFGVGPDSSGASSIGLGGGPGLGASSMGLGTGLGAAASSMGLGTGLGLGAGPSNPSTLSRRTSASVLLHAASIPASISGTELASYLASDTIQKFDDDFNILDYWHDHKITYPVLSILAKDVLSVLVSTVSSESAFSLVFKVIEERRRQLLPSMMEMLSLLKD
ncbi:hypothetical protein U9M48_002795 [Paspalum notatum var. saurae]|uniref:HAT C-terminal dimerisation domain-containing protein n=1 Tax=Paspalum notatum var. saurae TaxID=547442 RepID=A0AAQ3PS54_PASNO